MSLVTKSVTVLISDRFWSLSDRVCGYYQWFSSNGNIYGNWEKTWVI